MQSSSTAHFQPTILAIAESTHYLVGVMDVNDNFTGLGQSSAEVVGSLVIIIFFPLSLSYKPLTTKCVVYHRVVVTERGYRSNGKN